MTKSPRIRVLMQNRPGTFTQRGGDTVVLERTRDGLVKRGVEVTVDVEAKADPRNYDLVHLFNFATAEYTTALAQRAHQAGVPFVVTSLCEDVQRFHTQSHAAASRVLEYVSRGQDKSWWETSPIDFSSIAKAKPFDNAWLAKHAKAILVTGSREGQTIERLFGSSGNIRECLLGYEIGAAGNPDLFRKEYGVDDFIFCVGRLESRKNQLMLAKALEQSEIPLVLAAGGFTYQPEYADAVRKFKRKGPTIVLDRLAPEMLASAYAAARVHALPSWYELPGLVSIEAAYHGCNLVVTDLGTTRDYVGNHAFYCEPGDEISIFNAVIAAYYSPFQETLRELAMATTWDKTADTALSAYREALGLPPEQQTAAPITREVTIGDPTTGGYDHSPGVTEFQELVDKGEMAARAKDFATAHECLTRAEQMNPQSLRVQRARGAVYLAESKTDEAERHLRCAFGIDPRDAKTLSGLGMCLMNRGRAPEAYPFFVQALDRDGDSVVAMLQLIECAYSIGRFEDLERFLRSYLERHPDDANIRFCLAGCLYRQGKSAEAGEHNARVLELKPSHQGGIELAGLLRSEPVPANGITATASVSDRVRELDELKRSKSYDEAKSGCEALIQNPSINAAEREHAVLIRAEIAVLEGDFDRAHRAYDEVIRNSPSCSRAYCGKGTLAAHVGEWNTAQALFEQAHRYTPSYDVPLAGLGVCAIWAQKPEEAWSYFVQALERNPENSRALYGIIEVGIPLKRHTEIEARVRRYLELHPVDLEFMYTLAACMYAQGKVNEAVEELNRIAVFDPSNARAAELRTVIENRAA